MPPQTNLSTTMLHRRHTELVTRWHPPSRSTMLGRLHKPHTPPRPIYTPRCPPPRPCCALPADGIVARPPVNPDRSLINDDFAPTTREARTFDWCVLSVYICVGLGVHIDHTHNKHITTTFLPNVYKHPPTHTHRLDLASLWVGLVVCIPTYMLASGLVELGFSCAQGILTIFISNVITLVPMVLNAVPGTKYGCVLRFCVICFCVMCVYDTCMMYVVPHVLNRHKTHTQNKK